jgi:hypothetical protein
MKIILRGIILRVLIMEDIFKYGFLGSSGNIFFRDIGMLGIIKMVII